MAHDLLYKPMKLGPHTVPGVWRYMLPYELQTMEVPAERGATCDRCPRVHTDDYRPDYRCCTYYPRVPNFLLGLAAQKDATMRKRLQALVDQGWLLPEGFQATPQAWAVFLADTSEERFGKSTETLCPFLTQKNGFCSLYGFRNAVCSTFFCINDHGNKGSNYWNAVQDLVVQVEMGLGQFVLDEIGFDVDGYNDRLNTLAKKIDQVADKSTRRWSPKALKYLWGNLHGKEVQAFLDMASVIEQHRDRLWDIACAVPLREAQTYEQASYEVVPAPYRDELDEDDYGDDAEAAAPIDLWQEVKRKYQQLLQVPAYPLRLNPKAKIIANNPCDPLAESYKDHPFELRMHKRKDGHTADWRLFLTKSEAQALQVFDLPVSVTLPVIERLKTKLENQHPLFFVAKWSAKGVLVKDK